MAVRRAPAFTSKATLLFPPAPSSALATLTGTGSSDLPSVPLLGGALTVPQPGSSAGTATALVRSRRLEKQVIAAVKLDQEWKLTPVLMSRRFQSQLQCREGSNGELFLSFKDRKPDVAFQVLAEIINQLGAIASELRLDPAGANVRFLARRLKEAQDRVIKAQAALTTFQHDNHIVALPEEARAIAERYNNLQKEAAAAQMEAAIGMRQVDLLSASARRMIASAIDPTKPGQNGTLAPLYQRVKEAEAQLALLKSQFTDEHPQVVEATAALQQARNLLRAETQRQLGAVSTDSSPAIAEAAITAAANQARAAGLKSTLATLQQRIDTLPKQQAQFTQLTANLEAEAQSVKLYRQELEKGRILAQARGPMFVELDPPEKPNEPDPGGRLGLIVISCFLGLLIASLRPVWQWRNRQNAYLEMLYAGEQKELATTP